MSLGSFLSSLKIEKRQEKQSYNPYGCGLGLQFANSVPNQYAMNISAFFSAVNLISNAVASTPITLKRYRANGSNVVSNHPLNLIFQGKDGGLVNTFNAVKVAVEDIILRGQSFFYIYRENGNPVRLRHLEPNDVTIYYSKEDYSLLYQCSLVSNGWIQPEDMIHLYLHTIDGVQGISLLSYAKRSIDTATLTENSAKTYFGGKMANAAVLSVSGPLSEQQKQEIRQSWIQAFDGSSDSNAVAVLRGNISYIPISRNAEESQLLQNRQFTVDDIARWFSISPVLLGDLSHASYGSLESVQSDFILHAVSPYIHLFEQEFNKKLIKPSERGLYIDFEEQAILVQDKQSAANYYTTLVNAGILSTNEARRELGLNPIDGGDALRVSYTDISQNTINSDNTNGSDSTGSNGDDTSNDENK